MQTCDCGTCELCVMKDKVLEFARSRDWNAFEWTVCSTICAGEDMWNIFVNTHDLDELQWVLRAAETQTSQLTEVEPEVVVIPVSEGELATMQESQFDQDVVLTSSVDTVFAPAIESSGPDTNTAAVAQVPALASEDLVETTEIEGGDGLVSIVEQEIVLVSEIVPEKEIEGEDVLVEEEQQVALEMVVDEEQENGRTESADPEALETMPLLTLQTEEEPKAENVEAEQASVSKSERAARPEKKRKGKSERSIGTITQVETLF